MIYCPISTETTKVRKLILYCTYFHFFFVLSDIAFFHQNFHSQLLYFFIFLFLYFARHSNQQNITFFQKLHKPTDNAVRAIRKWINFAITDLRLDIYNKKYFLVKYKLCHGIYLGLKASSWRIHINLQGSTHETQRWIKIIRS